MYPEALVPAWRVVLMYSLSSPKDLSTSFVSDIIRNQSDLTPEDTKRLAELFGTSEQYWINLQTQYDKANKILETNVPCPDLAQKVDALTDTVVDAVAKEGTPLQILSSDGSPVYVITEQTYKYMLSKCTKDELWDMGILGNSETHVKKAPV